MKRNKLGTMRFEAKDENGKRTTVDMRRMSDGSLIIDLGNDPEGPMVLSPAEARKFLETLGRMSGKE